MKKHDETLCSPLLTCLNTNTVDFVAVPSNQLADHMNKEARVEREVAYDGGIIPNKIEVKEDGEWQEVEIATMM